MNSAAGHTLAFLLSTSVLSLGCAPHISAQAALKKTTLIQSAAKTETLGGGTVAAPAVGPVPTYGLGGPGMVLVKNWHFGTHGTIKNYADMNANFLYHDQHKSIANGSNAYGSPIVAPDDANAIFPGDVYYWDDDGTHHGRGLGTGQPIEGRDSAPVRQFTTDSIKTFLTPLKQATTMVNGVLTVLPDRHEVGCGSFMSKWFLPAAGSMLGQDLVWETKVRYKTPPYFWFSLWVDGDKWRWDNGARGAEIDLVETYGEDYRGGNTAYGADNFDGHLWHSGAVGTSNAVTYDDYSPGTWWGHTLAAEGIKSFDATQWHIWTLVYTHDNIFKMYVDGKQIQNGGSYYWTFGNRPSDPPINMDFRFDGGWGHRSVRSVDKPLAASALAGTYYEYAYSRVYLSKPFPNVVSAVSLPGTVKAVDYITGGKGVAYHQTVTGGQTLYRPDNSGADHGNVLSETAAGQWYKYKVSVPASGRYSVSFLSGSATGGKFHVEDEAGKNLTGSVTVPVTGDPANFQKVVVPAPVALSAGPHTLKWVQDTGGYDLYSMTVGPVEAAYHGPHLLPGTVLATDYDTGDAGMAYNQTAGGGQTGFRPDNSGADYGPALGWTAAGQWYKYTVRVAKTGSYTFSFRAGSPSGGTFHVEDETGRNLTGSVAVPSSGGYQSFVTIPVSTPVTLSAGPHILKWVQDTGNYDLSSMTLAAGGA